MSTAQDASTGTTTWTIDPAHTQVGFTVKHMMITKVRGRFTGVSGQIQLDEQDPTRSVVEVDIETSSIDTRQEDRDKHLRSGDFFDVESHPSMKFRSKRVEGSSLEPGSSFQITGDLTIRGVTEEVTLDAEYGGIGGDPWGGQRIAFSATGTVDRRKFGLEWNQALEAGGVLVGNDVRLELDVQAVKQEEEA